MNTWTIKTFVTSSGRNVIQEWMNGLPTRARVAIDERIRFLALGNFWHRPYADKLTGYANIWEIRVKSENVQYRPLGCCGPGDKVFSLLVGAREINKRFDPKDAPKIAEKREKLVYQDEGYLNEYC